MKQQDQKPKEEICICGHGINRHNLIGDNWDCNDCSCPQFTPIEEKPKTIENLIDNFEEQLIRNLNWDKPENSAEKLLLQDARAKMGIKFDIFKDELKQFLSETIQVLEKTDKENLELFKKEWKTKGKHIYALECCLERYELLRKSLGIEGVIKYA